MTASDLRQLAEAAQEAHGLSDWHGHDVALECGDFVKAASPSVVLSLIAAIPLEMVCVYCEEPIKYRPDDPVMHVGCAIAEDSEPVVSVAQKIIEAETTR